MSNMVTRTRRFFRRRFHLVEPSTKTVTRWTMFAAGTAPPWWRSWARIVTYGNGYSPRWSERSP